VARWKPHESRATVTAMPSAMLFADGENLVARYQALLKSGREPFTDGNNCRVHHQPDVFVWRDDFWVEHGNVRRATYYTSCIGDDNIRAEVQENIRRFNLRQRDSWTALTAYVVRRSKNTGRSKGVDIKLTTDFLTHAFNRNMDTAFLMSGDGDFVPMVEEAKRYGVRVIVYAFTSGLSRDLKLASDYFYSLDDVFFNMPPQK